MAVGGSIGKASSWNSGSTEVSEWVKIESSRPYTPSTKVEKPMLALSFYLALAVTNLFAAGTPEAQMAAEQEPIVSELGRRRILENLQLLDNSIADIKHNLDSTKHNVQTIRTELAELEQLEKEHLSLRTKYTSYLGFAKSESAKNEGTVRDLAKWEAQQKAAGEKLSDKQLQETLGAAQRELEDRKAWKLDADGKADRVRNLIRELDTNLREIHSRKTPLERQLSSWTKRMDEYQDLLTKTTQKRKELEALAKR